MLNTGYGFFDRVLHRLALQCTPVAKMSFDLDQIMVKADPQKIQFKRHVFISGLARAGTTILMRRFYETGLYRSLTYRDMPFVLAPNLWRLLSGISRREIETHERAHGDNILINADSPESLDEVFWRTFSGKYYIRGGHLTYHEPSDELIEQYVLYVNAIINADDIQKERYLSKNNNNILRLNSIEQAFPNALILIPFRDPVQHAWSLLKQHLRFNELQSSSKFMQGYMKWLGHHEFGLEHRPFLLNDKSTSQFSDDTINYWLNLWCEVYSWLVKTKPESAMFVCYEDLCTNDEIWIRIAKMAGLPKSSQHHELFKSANTHQTDTDTNKGLRDNANYIYLQLSDQARRKL